MTKKSHQIHKPLKEQGRESLHNLAYETIIKLETPLGINASGIDDRYAAFFGRDSMITCLKLLRVHKKRPDEVYLRIIRHTIQTSIRLQGETINLKSGEKPGKIVHEYREKGFDHLISMPNPRYTYPDNTLRNYDSSDSTLLFLILVAEFYNLTKDEKFLKSILPTIERAFFWAENFGHKGGSRLFIEYQLNRPEPYGGSLNQGWMDSTDSILIGGKPPKEPVALVEIQGYYFKALRLWSAIYKKIDKTTAQKYKYKSHLIKDMFNNLFLMRSEDLYYFAQAIFGQRAHILEVRSNPGHCLWSSVKEGGEFESIIEGRYIPDIVSRIMKLDLFEPKSGVRTLSTKSKFFDYCSYHNGSIWPFDNGLIAEGLENFGFKQDSEKIKQAVLNTVSQFGSAVELYCADKNGKIKEYYNEKVGHYGAHQQAWTAATILDFTT